MLEFLLQEAFKHLELRFQSERTILANAAEAELQARLAAEEREVQRALEATNDRRKRRNSCPTTSASSVCELHEKKIEELQEEVHQRGLGQPDRFGQCFEYKAYVHK
jgi:hypothetical protein